MSIIQVVKSCPLFYELYDDEIMKIVEKCRVISLEPGDFVFKKGEEGNEIFLLLNGSGSVMKDDIKIASLRKGDLFGEMVLLKDPIRHADICIDGFADILVVEYDDIFGLFETNSKVFSLLMLNLSRMLATRLKDTGSKVKDLYEENYKLKENCQK